MIIQSKFHDYYDCIQNIGGFDKSIVYKRKSEDVYKKIGMGNIKDYQKRNSLFRKSTFYELSISKIYVGYCSEIFPCLELYIKGCYEYIYNYQGFIDYVKKLNNKDLSYSVFSTEKKNWSSFKENKVIAFFDTEPKDFDNIFEKYKVPVFVAREYNGDYKFELNPCLKDYQFYKVKHGYEVFQEIEWYISGILSLNKKNVDNISDCDMIYKKGFDNRSFKTESPGKKSKRRKKMPV